MPKHEQSHHLAEALEQAESELERQYGLATSNDAQLIAAAITLAGVRIAYQLSQIAAKQP